MKVTVTLTREIEFDVVVVCNKGDEGQGWEYSVEDEPTIPFEELGLVPTEGTPQAKTPVEVILTNGEVDEAVALAVEG